MKYLINERFYGYHYSWCSPVFDAEALGRYSPWAGQAASSDPATIYRQLHIATVGRRADLHDAKVASYRATIPALALQKAGEGVLTAAEAEEIVGMVNLSAVSAFRPLMYVIPFDRVADRLQQVSVSRAASIEREYIIPDLKREEFEVVEFLPWH